VEITHYNLVALGTGIYDTERRHPDYEERARRASSVAFLPMYHAYCQAYFMISLPHQGMSVYIMPSFDLLKMLKHIETYRLTRLYAVPPVLVGMVKHPQTRKTDLSSIDTVGCGAAMLPPEVLTEVNRLVGGTEDNMVISQAWGMSEVTCTATARDPVKLADRGVGELAPGNKAKILGEDGKEILEAGVPGEVYLSSPTLMRGYWRNPQATAETITTDKDGTRWLRTGDILYVDKYEPGALFHIVDRVKELIKVRGFQVSPAELDGVLLERDDVADVGVVGIQLEDGEEAPRAYIVRKPGTNASAEEIDQWVSKRVAPYKKLRGGIAFIEAIPKNPVRLLTSSILYEVAPLLTHQEM
jgi:4-coumarate--CoA ligase